MTAVPEGRTSAVSVWRRQIELPRYLRKVHGAAQLAAELSSVCEQLGFSRPLLLSGPTVTMELARQLAPVLGGAAEPLRVGDNSQAEVDSIAHANPVAEADVLVAIGGGRTIDVAKAVCEAIDLPVITVPTQLTADGIASPVSVIRARSGEIESRRARLPIGVVVDLDFVAGSAPERVRAGLGDLLANRSAVRDWRLAAAAGADTVDDFAALLAESAGELVYGTDVSSVAAGRPSDALLERLLDGLVLSGLAMEIAGSSRPCSGSEHLVSHAIDRLYPGTAQHGEQVAFGSLLSTRLQGEDWQQLRQFLLDAGMQRSAAGLGLGQEQVVAALKAAPATRPGRHTVLDELDLSDADLSRLVGELLIPAYLTASSAGEALVRRAASEDAEAVAELIYATSPKLHDRFVGGKAQALVMLTAAFGRPGTNVSAEVVHVAELNGRVAGAMACFAADEARRRGRAVLRVALGCTPIHRWPAALSLYLRGGRMTAGPPPRSLYVDSLATDERLRRRGAARALLARADQLARSQRLVHVALDTDVENMAARHLYESSGFIGVAETRPRGGLPGFVSYVKTL